MKLRFHAAILTVLFSCMGFLLHHGNAAASAVTTTKHNLSVSGPGTYRATAEDRVCLVCHTPHNSDPAGPLWNHTLSGETYQPYTSTTLVAAPGQPTGNSKLCLACHDGTVALGSVHNMPGSSEGAGIIPGLEDTLTGEANIGTDLRDDHPISFVYDNDLFLKNTELADPATLGGDVQVDQNGELQCTSCHDPHNEQYPMFLHMGFTGDPAGYGSPLCRTCHSKDYWEESKHRESEAEWNSVNPNPWHLSSIDATLDTVRENGCENCHKPHSGGGRVITKDGEEQVCFNCHNGNVNDPLDPTPTWDIEASYAKSYVHPTETVSGAHKPKRVIAEGYKVREEPADLNVRHAECEDCHNPHAAWAGVTGEEPVSPDPEDAAGDTTTNTASNALRGVWGVEPSSWPGNWVDVTNYSAVDNVVFQYQLCLKCHSYYAFEFDPPESPYDPTYELTDQAKEFNPNNASYHPVASSAASKNDFSMTVGASTYDYSSSLLNGLTINSTIGCTDCHSDPDSLPAIDTAGKGPHGSEYWPILNAPWDKTTGQASSWGAGHLCFRCHDEDVYTYQTGSTGGTSAQKTGFSSLNDLGPNGCGESTNQRRNLHAFHSCKKDPPCNACHSTVPHGMERRALLIYAKDPVSDVGADPEPYNAQTATRRVSIGGNTNYGIPSSVDVDSIASGNWQKADCHDTGPGDETGCSP
jgi:predicted CXXCH cytochrome family protein